MSTSDTPPPLPATPAPDDSAILDPAPLEAPPFDANGFDPREFEWRPVPRRPRSDGWTPDVQRRFIQALAETGQVQLAAQAVDMSVQSAYRLRVAPGSEGFAKAWAAALHVAIDRLVDHVFTRVFEGDEIPYYDRDGNRLGARRVYSDRMTMFLLRAHRPDRYGTAHRHARSGAEPLPAAEAPLPEAQGRLGPVEPAAPHTLMPPEVLAERVEAARAVAEVHARYPVDARERYVRPTVPDGHPVAAERRSRRERREREAEERRLARQHRRAAARSPWPSHYRDDPGDEM